MKSKQLANVLIKVLGLYICLCAIPEIIGGILTEFTLRGLSKPDAAQIVMRTVSFALGFAMQAVVGIIIIIKSRKIAEFWFKNEDE
ncbi:MAG: hypothetical protein ABSE48_20815 [Verrucomicrobiota bacterium]|jgi:hypothetical protein